MMTNADKKYELRNGTSIEHEMASALKIADVAVLFWNAGIPYLGSSIEYLNQWDGKRYIICPPNEVPRLACALGIIPTPAANEGILVVDNSRIDVICDYLSSLLSVETPASAILFDVGNSWYSLITNKKQQYRTRERKRDPFAIVTKTCYNGNHEHSN